MPEAVIGGILLKKLFFKISQNLQETLLPEKTPVYFAKLLSTPFLQNNSGRLLLKCKHWKKEVDAMLIASAEIPKREGTIWLSNFYGHLPHY